MSDDVEAERKLFAKFRRTSPCSSTWRSRHWREGRAEIKDGSLVMKEEPPTEDKNK